MGGENREKVVIVTPVVNPFRPPTCAAEYGRVRLPGVHVYCEGGGANSTIPNKKLTSPPVRPFAIRGGRVISLEETNGKTTYRKPRTARTRRRLVRIARGTTRSYTPRDYREILVFRTSRIIIIIIINTRAVSADTVNARAPDIICTRGTGRVLLRDTVFGNNVLPSANDVIF